MQNGLTENQGVRVTIENNTKIPFIVSEGINIMPRTSTNVALVESQHARLKEPFSSNCSDAFSAEYNDYINFTFNTAYSSSMCRHLCYMDYMVKNCDCYFPYIEGNIPFDPAGKRFCNMDPNWNNTDLTCLLQVLGAITTSSASGDSLCKCNPECYETTYRVNVL